MVATVAEADTQSQNVSPFTLSIVSCTSMTPSMSVASPLPMGFSVIAREPLNGSHIFKEGYVYLSLFHPHDANGALSSSLLC